MTHNCKYIKVTNNKIQWWHLEVAPFSCQIQYYRSGTENSVLDTLTGAFCSAVSTSTLDKPNCGVCHPGMTQLVHFVKSKIYHSLLRKWNTCVLSC